MNVPTEVGESINEVEALARRWMADGPEREQVLALVGKAKRQLATAKAAAAGCTPLLKRLRRG
ncbi:MAG: hypothetical protein FJ320_10710 [SAR202 cluster bacterium]|nr:hypothetical protein [SAR202 cluster bacterium]